MEWDEDPTNFEHGRCGCFSPQGGYNYGRFLELHAYGDVCNRRI